MTIKFETVEKEMLADPAVRAEYERLRPEFELANELIKARKQARLSQGQVAQRMKTTQSAVARIESGRHPLNMKTVHEYAAAVGSRVSVCLAPIKVAAKRAPRAVAAKTVARAKSSQKQAPRSLSRRSSDRTPGRRPSR